MVVTILKRYFRTKFSEENEILFAKMDRTAEENSSTGNLCNVQTQFGFTYCNVDLPPLSITIFQ